MSYTDQERADLVRLLRYTTPSKAETTRSLDGTSDELRRSKRAVYELDRAARDCIDEFRELRGGVLNERLATISKLESLQKASRLISVGLQEQAVRQALAAARTVGLLNQLGRANSLKPSRLRSGRRGSNRSPAQRPLRLQRCGMVAFSRA